MEKISPKTKELEPIPGLKLFLLRMPVQGVVSIKGSILGGEVFSPNDNPILALTVADMLDEGTRSHSKNVIREKLESVGASISFSSGQNRVGFSSKCLTLDTALVIRLIAEQLREPAFKDSEFEIFKKIAIGSLEQQREETGSLVRTAIRRKVFSDVHPNYAFDIDESINFLRKTTTADLRTFHDKNYGLGEAVMVVVGDFDEKKIVKEVEKSFGDWHQSGLPRSMDFTPISTRKPEHQFITIKDKENTDLAMGQALGINRDHPDFDALSIGIRIFGGDFSSRLNTYVRGKLGLTYGIRTLVNGTAGGYDGFFAIRGIFAPTLLGRGIQESRKIFETWTKDGVTEEELDEKKKTISGEYIVGLETTGSLSGGICAVAERGKPISYLDEYPEIIKKITLEEVNSAIKKYIDSEKMITVAAGSIDSQGKPLED